MKTDRRLMKKIEERIIEVKELIEAIEQYSKIFSPTATTSRPLGIRQPSEGRALVRLQFLHIIQKTLLLSRRYRLNTMYAAASNNVKECQIRKTGRDPTDLSLCFH